MIIISQLESCLQSLIIYQFKGRLSNINEVIHFLEIFIDKLILHMR